MLEETPLPVTTACYVTVVDHDETAALEVLGRVPVTVLVGTHDRLTRAARSRRIADIAGPGAEPVVATG